MSVKEKPSREELKKLIKKWSIVDISKMYYCHESTVVDWLEEYEIDYPSGKAETWKRKKSRYKEEAKKFIEDIADDRFPLDE